MERGGEGVRQCSRRDGLSGRRRRGRWIFGGRNGRRRDGVLYGIHALSGISQSELRHEWKLAWIALKVCTTANIAMEGMYEFVDLETSALRIITMWMQDRQQGKANDNTDTNLQQLNWRLTYILHNNDSDSGRERAEEIRTREWGEVKSSPSVK